MGEVYLATDIRLERDVAIKVLPTSFTPGSQQFAQFEQEARLLASLNHPSICAIYDVGSDRGLSFIVMEQLQGETLAARIARGPVSSHVVLRYAIQIVQGLKAAHNAGVIHRDIKPGNIMLTTAGVKLLDFGVAKRHDAVAGPGRMADTPSTPTRKEVPVGTLFYMSPEQLRGGAADHRSDIWAFGCVLYEMLTGKRAFTGKTMTDVIAAIVNERPLVMNVESGIVPIALEQIVARCLTRDPAQRWQTAGEIERELLSMLPHALAPERHPQPQHAPAPQPRAAQLSSSAAPNIALPADAVEESPRPFLRPRVWVAIAAATLLLVAAIWFVLARPDVPPEGGAIVVLPFTISTGVADVEYVSEGLAEGLADELARIEGLRTIPVSTSFRVRSSSSSDSVKAARQLGASRLVKGSLRVQNGRIELDTELIDSATGSTLWNGHYSEQQTGLLLLHRKLIEGVVRALRVTPNGILNVETLPPELNPEAHRLTLRGRHALRRRTDRSLKNAIGFFTDASTRDSRAAAAYAGLAEGYLALANPTVAAMKPREALVNAKKAAQRAIELDSRLAEAHLALATARIVGDWDWQGASADFHRALLLRPNDPLVHLQRAQWLMDTGRSDEALTEARIAIELDPQSPAANLDLGRLLYFARRYVESIERLKEAVSLDPDSPAPHWALGLAYEKVDRFDDAVREMEIAGTSSAGKPIYLAGLGYVYARDGRVKEAAQALDRVRAAATRVDFPPFDLALLALALDDADATFKWLTQAIDDHSPAVMSLAVDPRLDPLRSDPRFKDLLVRIGR